MSRRFRTSNKFLSKYTKDLLLEFEDTFAMLMNGDGGQYEQMLPVEKIPLALQSLGLEIPKTYYEEIINGREYLEFENFLSILETAMQSEHHSNFMLEELQEMFDVFDKDRSGKTYCHFTIYEKNVMIRI